MMDSSELERYRPYLHALARAETGRRLQGKLDVSGVVQVTLLEATQSDDRFRGTTDAERMAWLRRILARNLADEWRKLGAAMRDAGREQSLDAALDDSSARLGLMLAAEQSSPSQRLDRQEQVLRLTAALTQLPDAQREAVELHHLQGLTLVETAERMERTKGAVASLVFRGLERLRQMLDDSISN